MRRVGTNGTRGMPLVLFNIGWMQRYRGLTDDDRILNGGKYVEENETGAEVENFLPKGGFCYGYVGVSIDHRINLHRLGAGGDEKHVDGITVIFTATRPEGGRVVVGWYKHARVWRNMQENERSPYFFTRAKAENCTLLEIDERVFSIPKARQGVFGMGQSTVRYTDKVEAQEFVIELQKYISSPAKYRFPKVDEDSPRQTDPHRRSAVERAAVGCVIAHYEGNGFKCNSVEKDNKGWDLEARRGIVELLIEVKGCSGTVGQVELTPNEYSAMTDRKYREKYRLAIVTQTLDERRRCLSIVSYNGPDKTWRDQNGRSVRVVERTGARIGLQ